MPGPKHIFGNAIPWSNDGSGSGVACYWELHDFTPYLETKVKVAGKDMPFAVIGTWFDKTLNLPADESVSTGMRGLKS